MTLTLGKIKHAQNVLKDVINHTELTYAPCLKANSDCEIYLKCENLQLTGSFKLRGGYYKMSQLSEEEKAHGVIACSAGNHAQGVALAAQKGNINATICIPASAPLAKIEATRSYGANVVLVNGVFDDAFSKAVEMQKEFGYTFVHPFNDEDVIAGQGTIGLEIMDELFDADMVIVPIGGGGLISGIAFAVKSINPSCKVYGVEPSAAASMLTSLENKEITELATVATFADGIAVKKPGDLTFEICKNYVDKIVTVSESEIAAAILTLIEKQRIVAEGAGAASVAAVLSNKIDTAGKKVVCIVSGGNIDVNTLSRVINKGLIATGRSAKLSLELSDKPGQLKIVTSLISELGANVVSINHDRTQLRSAINACVLDVVLETIDFDHIEKIKEALEAQGLKIL